MSISNNAARHLSVYRTATLFAAAIALFLTGCGEAPSFLEREEIAGKGTGGSGVRGASGNGISASEMDGLNDADATAGEGSEGGGADGSNGSGGSGVDTDGDGLPDSVDPDPTSGPGGPNSGPPVSGAPGTPNNMPNLPGANDEDVETIRRCMQNWNANPFGNSTVNIRRIYASVSVGGIGTAINDTMRTQSPELVIIYAGVNVLGSTTWNLANPNGWYCAKVNVNVQSTFTINLHCNARLSDSRVNVNVGSNQNNTTAAIGVNVLSNVTVNSIRPQGDACIR